MIPIDPYTYRLIKEHAEEVAEKDHSEGEYHGFEWSPIGKTFYDRKWRELEKGKEDEPDEAWTM